MFNEAVYVDCAEPVNTAFALTSPPNINLCSSKALTLCSIEEEKGPFKVPLTYTSWMKVESLVTVILPVITDVPICLEEPVNKKLPVISCVLCVVIPNWVFPDANNDSLITKDDEKNVVSLVINISLFPNTDIPSVPLATKLTPELCLPITFI